jgi:hypothetical protein
VFTTVGIVLDGWDLAAPLLAYGIGMGMIFAPLFDTIMAGVADHEVGSASGVLESAQQLGASLGVAVLATLFFSTVGGDTAGDSYRQVFLDAAARTTLLALALTGLAFALGFLLPKKARHALRA